jgi:hypothetical protein
LDNNLWVYTDPDAVGPILLWLLEKLPALQNREPIEQWLREAITLTRGASGKLPVDPQVARSACDTLLSFASTAVKRATQARAKSFRLINPIDVILNLTLAYEEGTKCSGNILFSDAAQAPTHYLSLTLMDTSRPTLTSTKHLRKLIMSVENSPLYILTDRVRAVGIIDKRSADGEVKSLFDRSIAAKFGLESTFAQMRRDHGPKMIHPAPNSLVGDHDAPFRQQVFDVT